jgi:hypothetical protein
MDGDPSLKIPLYCQETGLNTNENDSPDLIAVTLFLIRREGSFEREALNVGSILEPRASAARRYRFIDKKSGETKKWIIKAQSL